MLSVEIISTPRMMAPKIRCKILLNVEIPDISVKSKFQFFLELSGMSCVCLRYLCFLSSMLFLGSLCYFRSYLTILPVEMLKYLESGSAEFFTCPGGGKCRVDL